MASTRCTISRELNKKFFHNFSFCMVLHEYDATGNYEEGDTGSTDGTDVASYVTALQEDEDIHPLTRGLFGGDSDF